MWHKNRIAIGMLLGVVMSVMMPATHADLLPEDAVLLPKYMVAERDSEIYSLVGERVIPVGEIKEDQLIQVLPAAAEYYEFKFGNGISFIDKDDLRDINKARKTNDILGDLNKPVAESKYSDQACNHGLSRSRCRQRAICNAGRKFALPHCR